MMNKPTKTRNTKAKTPHAKKNKKLHAKNTRKFHTTTPQHGLLDWFKRHAEIDELKGAHVGTDPKGHKYYEWREPHSPPDALPRRRVEYAGGDWAPADLHVFWDAWLRHHRKLPPSPDEIQRHAVKMEKYYQRVAMHEMRDAKLRKEEQMQRKLSGEVLDQEQMSAENYVKGLEAQMAKIRMGQEQDAVIGQQQYEEENGPQRVAEEKSKI